jgi:hypothetical protein
MIKTLLGLFALLLVTLVTQVGGLAFALCWIASRFLFPARLRGWWRAGASIVLFIALYAVLNSFVVPRLAALAGRVPLPCHAEADRPFAAANPIYCWLGRNYVDARLLALLTSLSRDIDRAYPGTVTLFLDGNFPFLNGFPLLPHLSHIDGRKLDIAFYYASPSGAYLPGRLRSPIGYWGFEQPAADDTPRCRGRSWLSLRWDMTSLQHLYPDRPLEPARTRAALDWLVTKGQEFALERVFIEPYLAARLGVSSPLIGFQGCRAARHDDHIHFQVKRS